MHLIDQVFFKRAILLVDVQIITFKKIIRNKDIFPAIVVNIPDAYSQTKADYTSVNSCFFTYINKKTVLVFH